MKLQYCSDLHLEFPENKQFLEENPIKPVGEVLILAGDVVPFVVMHEHQDFFDYVSDNFETTYWIPGNHEYYYSDLAGRCGSLYEKIRSNVFLVNNYRATVGNLSLIFSTLWTRLSIENQLAIQKGLSDFRVITNKNQPLTCSQYIEQHEACRSFIAEQLKSKSNSAAVVTHHVPTFLNYPEKFKGDVFNEAFAVELYDLIEHHGPDYWIFGHHHQNGEAFKIGHTSLISNQLGYVRYGEHVGFDRGKVINLGPPPSPLLWEEGEKEGGLNNKPTLKEERRLLRNNPTSAEYLLWQNLKGKKLEGRKFRRQHSFGNYIMDFYCPEEKLAIELDGQHHFTPDGRKADQERDAFLADYGIKVLRFENKEVLHNIAAVRQKIKDALTTPPPSERRGLGGGK